MLSRQGLPIERSTVMMPTKTANTKQASVSRAFRSLATLQLWYQDGHPQAWRPVLDEDGRVCLTDGRRIIGRRP